MRYIYMDYAATTPVSSDVLKSMLPYFSQIAGNPSSVHREGRETHTAIERARAQTAEAIGAKPREIYFTSGGSESDNWAIKGIALSGYRRDKKHHIITTAIEHHAVLNACHYLEKYGFRVTQLGVDRYGRVDPADVEKAICADTVLISVMAANNEIGTLEPVSEIGKIAREHEIPFHIDAVQAIGNIPVNVEDWQADLLSLSAHKFYGPKGVGALYIRKGTRLDPFIHGGSQERGHRGGTENVPGIVGLGHAITISSEEMKENAARICTLRDQLIRGILDAIPESQLNGHPTDRLAGNVSIAFPGTDQEILLRQLELHGILASAGAACASGQTEPSHVLTALGIPWENVTSTIRFSLGATTTEQEIAAVLSALPDAVRDARNMQRY